jgi:predicted TPR repeat methyltransferase
MTGKKFMDTIYQVAAGDAMRDTYNQWADQYDADLQDQDYRTPKRVALALSRHLNDLHAPILDFACGTGLSGLALQQQGFTCIDGVDLSEKMLSQAMKKGVYRSLVPCSAQEPFAAVTESHQAIVATGAIGAGAAPLECLSLAIEHLAPGGLFCVSLNDHTLEDPRYEAIIAQHVADGSIEVLEQEHGAHLPALNLGAKVYVIRKQA